MRVYKGSLDNANPNTESAPLKLNCWYSTSLSVHGQNFPLTGQLGSGSGQLGSGSLPKISGSLHKSQAASRMGELKLPH